MKFLITCLTAVFVSCPQTPEVEVSPAQEYKITYTVSGTGKDAVTVNGPAIKINVQNEVVSLS